MCYHSLKDFQASASPLETIRVGNSNVQYNEEHNSFLLYNPTNKKTLEFMCDTMDDVSLSKQVHVESDPRLPADEEKNTIVLEGFLDLWSKYAARWEEKYIVLTKRELLVFSADEETFSDDKAEARILLRRATASDASDASDAQEEDRYVLRVFDGKRRKEYLLAASSEQNMIDWLDAILESIEPPTPVVYKPVPHDEDTMHRRSKFALETISSENANEADEYSHDKRKLNALESESERLSQPSRGSTANKTSVTVRDRFMYIKEVAALRRSAEEELSCRLQVTPHASSILLMLRSLQRKFDDWKTSSKSFSGSSTCLSCCLQSNDEKMMTGVECEKGRAARDADGARKSSASDCSAATRGDETPEKRSHVVSAFAREAARLMEENSKNKLLAASQMMRRVQLEVTREKMAEDVKDLCFLAPPSLPLPKIFSSSPAWLGRAIHTLTWKLDDTANSERNSSRLVKEIEDESKEEEASLRRKLDKVIQSNAKFRQMIQDAAKGKAEKLRRLERDAEKLAEPQLPLILTRDARFRRACLESVDHCDKMRLEAVESGYCEARREMVEKELERDGAGRVNGEQAFPVIASILPGSSAAAAARSSRVLSAGCELLKIDGQDLKGVRAEEATILSYGAPGTHSVILVRKEMDGKQTSDELALVRTATAQSDPAWKYAASMERKASSASSQLDDVQISIAKLAGRSSAREQEVKALEKERIQTISKIRRMQSVCRTLLLHVNDAQTRQGRRLGPQDTLGESRTSGGVNGRGAMEEEGEESAEDGHAYILLDPDTLRPVREGRDERTGLKSMLSDLLGTAAFDF
ncbi:hypothetical protein GUITHDRAFT_99549 [Guillardia theta CCMP2712]|uniref:PH domain-containing protein n=1 Tax=Guillardia theta (strain CCMP2712) TaxID=905079 RepID=L1K2S6_GUITC|nr:hypothetical protein GUITHDRAFT_99549 [Guillardia theta CCMP2712]EKX54899.1 hypothetical protein GUITHDRAFT_99549 [Guillardia theta CCMP2712]|eukprot:XP_005841879.1 hypothetical protein GUITHDRAFT_99549 [Guillardia theta CCMP2712]